MGDKSYKDKRSRTYSGSCQESNEETQEKSKKQQPDQAGHEKDEEAYRMIESGNEKILIFAPHADDEVLGCGGLIEKACRYNNEVKVVLGTTGNTMFYHTGQVVASE